VSAASRADNLQVDMSVAAVYLPRMASSSGDRMSTSKSTSKSTKSKTRRAGKTAPTEHGSVSPTIVPVTGAIEVHQLVNPGTHAAPPRFHEDRHASIAEAAYFRSLRRGFAPGHELEDWLAAEEEVDQRLIGEGRPA
jgi:hypothetical protein